MRVKNHLKALRNLYEDLIYPTRWQTEAIIKAIVTFIASIATIAILASPGLQFLIVALLFGWFIYRFWSN